MKKILVLILVVFSSLIFAETSTTQAFLAIVPEGIYQGNQDNGEACTVSVKLHNETAAQVQISNSSSLVRYEIIDGTEYRPYYNVERKIFRQNSTDSNSAIGTIIVENSQVSVSVSNRNDLQMALLNCVISIK